MGESQLPFSEAHRRGVVGLLYKSGLPTSSLPGQREAVTQSYVLCTAQLWAIPPHLHNSNELFYK